MYDFLKFKQIFFNTEFPLVAWEAFKQFELKSGSQEQLLPNNDNNQLFFISFAQSWCTSVDMVDPYNVHSPPRARVLGSIMNSHNFANAFKCSGSAPMNPKNKCMIWDENHSSSSSFANWKSESLKAVE